MTAEVLFLGGNALISLLFSFIPSAESWFGQAPAILKRLILMVAVAVYSLFIFLLACAGLLSTLNWNLTCDEAGAMKLVGLFLAAVGTSNFVYTFTPVAWIKRKK